MIIKVPLALEFPIDLSIVRPDADADHTVGFSKAGIATFEQRLVGLFRDAVLEALSRGITPRGLRLRGVLVVGNVDVGKDDGGAADALV